MPLHRRKPYSAKQKKAQMQAKRAQKRELAMQYDPEWDFRHHEPSSSAAAAGAESKPDPHDNPVPNNASGVDPRLTQAGGDGRNKLTSHFDKLTRAEIEANKQRSMQPLHRLSPEDGLTMSFDQAYSADVDIPVRPRWKYGEPKEQIEERESAYFAEWLDRIQQHKDNDTVSLYEKNLEVWRQLWRVVEISDILLLVVDIRHPVLHFPPSLYRYITETTGKPLVVVLNKTDLVAPDTVHAWMHYFQSKFPSVALTTFCCYRDTQSLVSDTNVADMKMRKKRPRRRVYDPSHVGDLFAACRDVCEPNKLGLVDWSELISRYTNAESDSGNEHHRDAEVRHPATAAEATGESDDSDYEGDNADYPDIKDSASRKSDEESEGEEERVSSKYVTLGLVGHPNVGKSTVINSIVRKTVVSTSRTPGHTKHFQTIHVTPTLRLCDCPGLVFPCVVQRPMQVLAGLYNIAQVQEPYTSVQFLAERIALERVLSLSPPTDTLSSEPSDILDAAKNYQWSAWSICEAFAIDRGFYTSKAARPDVYRAGKFI
ncbi:hypothetical protein H4R20_006064 [Coemansia guatemalensis]|uniref:Guanine nucleotide-binding protein-like 1 n=1 Tax=Coemansia guatemalensis TaxID=2761395 RepID=A0A9W8HUG5_9FUNG|nr:hypothetical protein H4R20_006064 [Coemansia guatemalensis]